MRSKILFQLFLAATGLLLLSSCMSTYEVPRPDEPSALIKFKINWDKGKASLLAQQLGASYLVNVNLWDLEQEKQYHLLQKTQPRLIDASESTISTFATSLHPDTKLRLVVWMGVQWQTQEPRQVYDSATKTYRTQWQTVHHQLGCAAERTFTPKQGDVYLMDYNNHDIKENCGASIYQQLAKKGGGFQLKAVK